MEDKGKNRKQRRPKNWLQEIAPQETPVEEETPAVTETPAAPAVFDDGVKVQFSQPEDPVDAAALEEADRTIEESLDAQPGLPPPSEWELFVEKLPKHVARSLLHAGLYTLGDLQQAREKDLLQPNGPFSTDEMTTLKAALADFGYTLNTSPVDIVPNGQPLEENSEPLVLLRKLINRQPPRRYS